MEKNHYPGVRTVLLSALVLTLVLAGCPTSIKDTESEPLAIESGESGLMANLTQRSLTVSFNKKITEVDTNKIKVYTTDSTGTKSQIKEEDIQTIGINSDGNLVVILKNNLDPVKKYSVEVDKGAVKSGSEEFAAKETTEEDAVLETPVVTQGDSSQELRFTFTKPVIAEGFAFDKAKIATSPSSFIVKTAVFDTDRKILTITFDKSIPSTGIKLTFAQGAFNAASDSTIVEYDALGPVWNKVVPVVDGGSRIFHVGFGERVILTEEASYKLERTAGDKTKETLSASDYNAVVDTDNASLKFTITNPAKVASDDTFVLTINANSVQDLILNGNTEMTISGIKVEDNIAPSLSDTVAAMIDNVITVSFDENIAELDKTRVEIRSKAEESNPYPKTALESGKIASVDVESTNKKLIKITLKENPAFGHLYQVKFLAEAVEDTAGNANTAVITTEVTAIPSDSTPPALGTSPNASLNEEQKQITVNLSEVIARKDDSKIKISRKASGGDYDTATTTGRTVALNSGNNKIIVTLVALNNDETIKVVFEAGALTDAADNTNDALKSGEVVVGDVTPPALDTSPNASLNKAQKQITVNLSEVISTKDDSKIKISRKASGGDYDTATTTGRTVALNSGNNKIIVTLAALNDDETIKVVFEAGALTDTADNTNEALESGEVVVGDVTPPALGGSPNASLDEGQKQITVNLSETVTRKDDSKIKISRKASGGDYGIATTTGRTVTLNSGNNKIIVTLAALNDDETIKVVFEAGALTDAADNTNKALESGEVVVGDVTPPALGTSPNTSLNKAQKQITVNLSEVISAKDDSKIKISRRASGGDYDTATTTGRTVALNSVSNKIIITLAALNDSETIKVVFEVGALTDAAGNTSSSMESEEASVGDITKPILGGTNNDGDPVLNKKAKTITVSLSEAVSSKDDSKIKISRKASGGNYGTATTSGRTVALNSASNKIIITLAALNDDETIKVVFEAGALTDATGNSNTALESKEINAGDVTPPALGTSPNASLNEDQKQITVNLSEAVTSKDDSKIKISRKASGGNYGTATTTGRTVALNSASNKIIITLAALNDYETVKVVFEVGALTDAAANTNNALESGEVVVGDVTPPALGGDDSDGDPLLVISSKTITISLSEAVTSKDDSKIKIKRKYSGAEDYLEPTTEGRTVALNSDNDKIIITLTRFNDSESIKVLFEAGALTDATGNTSNVMESGKSDVGDITKPAYRYTGKDTTNKTITIGFSENITLLSKSKVRIEYALKRSGSTYSYYNPYHYSVSSSGKELSIRVAGGLSSYKYKVMLFSGCVKDEAGNLSNAITVTVS